MTGHQSSEQAKADQISKMGDSLGAIYHALWQQLAWLHVKWEDYVTLFGKKPSRLKLLNKASPEFFGLVQRVLWDDIILHIARLTDPHKSTGKSNLSIHTLIHNISHYETQIKVTTLCKEIVVQSEFCRDWRNRRIAHSDLALATCNNAEPLILASRLKVSQVLGGLDAVLNAVSEHYLGSTTIFSYDDEGDGAMALLHVLDRGLKAEAEIMEKLKSGIFDFQNFTNNDL